MPPLIIELTESQFKYAFSCIHPTMRNNEEETICLWDDGVLSTYYNLGYCKKVSEILVIFTTQSPMNKAKTDLQHLITKHGYQIVKRALEDINGHASSSGKCACHNP